MTKIIALKLVAFSILVSSASAYAASTVTFQGEVASQTCTVGINNSTNSIVMMSTIPLSELYNSAGTTTTVGNSAGLTPFTISVSGCTASETSLTLYPEFIGTNVDTATFALGNTASTNAATGVGIAIYTDATGTNQLELNDVTKGAALTLAAKQTSTSATYSAKYMATSATTTAGKVTGVAQYTISYF